MFDRLSSLAKWLSSKINDLGNKVFGGTSKVAKNVSDPEGPQQETGLDPDNQRVARDFQKGTEDELKHQWELSSKGLGGAALKAEEKINEFADTLEKSDSVIHWAVRNLKALVAIAAGVCVAVLAGIGVRNFTPDHPVGGELSVLITRTNR